MPPDLNTRGGKNSRFRHTLRFFRKVAENVLDNPRVKCYIKQALNDKAHARVVELADSLDSGSSVHSGRAGSSPASRTIRGTSFVYQDKRGFFLLSGQNTGRIIEKTGFGAIDWLLRSPFLRSAAKEYRNRCCTNRISLLCKQLLNVFMVWDLNLLFAKNPAQVMI